MRKKVKREELLLVLESIRSGLATKDMIEQSDCFVFMGEYVYTYNEEIFCSCKSPFPSFTGAIKARPLLSILNKLPESKITFEFNNESLKIIGNRRETELPVTSGITLDMTIVEKPGKWQKLPSEFEDAINLVKECASKDETVFKLTCVNLHPKWIEASDDTQITRYQIKTRVREPILVKCVAIAQVIGMGMTEFSETDSWIHFRNSEGLIMSCNRFIDMDYPSDTITENLAIEGEPATLPKVLIQAAERAEIFTQENANNLIKVELRPGKIRIVGEGDSGKQIEFPRIKYKGKHIKFLISPKLLSAIVERHNECTISPEVLKVNSGKFTYVTCLDQVEDKKKGKKNETD